MSLERRGFLASMGALAGFAALKPGEVLAAQAAQGWDMSWLDRLKGSHKQVFDLSDMEIGLTVVKNWLDAWQSVYGLKYPDLNAVVGIGGHAFPINASDAMFQKYPIGEMWKLTDPDTGKPAMRNLHLSGGDAKVRPLQERGVIFWMCNNALHNVAGRIGRQVNQPADQVYADLRSGLNPGVILVPAHTMLIGLCQERGCSYEGL
ncbi:MAG TPA: hypothetical protein VF187_11005 [Gemmatimonadales bacterium]